MALESAGEGYYYIKSKHSEFVMDVSAESQSNWAPVLVYPQNWKNNQRFMFTDAD
ncbi:MAG: RICIN domain-containing protein [Oligoflexales bacterium]